jgi:hypothetical protein
MYLYKVLLLGLAIAIAPWAITHSPSLGQHAQSIPSPAKPSEQSFTEVQRNSLQLMESMMRDVVTLDLKKTRPLTFLEKYGTFGSNDNPDVRELRQNNWPLGQNVCRKPPDPNGVAPCSEDTLREWIFYPRRKTFFRYVGVEALYLLDERRMLLETVFYGSDDNPADKTTVKGMNKWFGNVFSPTKAIADLRPKPFRLWKAEKYQFRNLKNHRFDLSLNAELDEPDEGEDSTVRIITFGYTFNPK